MKSLRGMGSRDIIEYTGATPNQLRSVCNIIGFKTIKGAKREYNEKEVEEIYQNLVNHYGLTIYQIFESKINQQE